MPYSRRAAGSIWLTSVVCSVSSLVLALRFEVTLVPHLPEQTLMQIHRHLTPHLLELGLDSLSFVALAVAGVLLYGTFRERGALLRLTVLGFVAAAIVGILHNTHNFAVAVLSPAESSLILLTLQTAKWGIASASLFILLGVFCFSGHLIAAGVTWLGWAGVLSGLAGLGSLGCSVLVLTGRTDLEMTGYLLYLGVLMWQVACAFHLMGPAPVKQPSTALS